MKHTHKLLVLMLLALPFTQWAQGFQVNLQGQKQQGMGGAGSALMQDASAVFFNPGGMSFLKENSVCAGATATIANSVFLDADNSSLARTKSPLTTKLLTITIIASKLFILMWIILW